MTNASILYDADSVLKFWREAESCWFAPAPPFDDEFRGRFMAYHLVAAARRLDSWSGAAASALSLVLLLDQFPRNAFRHTAHMFATDPLARLFAVLALERRYDDVVDAKLRKFFYLPFMHSEALEDQERSVELFRNLDETKHAESHAAVIRRFGRFPHRNAALGRPITSDEQLFLDAGGFAG